MDRLESMEVFVKAVDLGSFAAAAATLDLSGPMVGKHVRFLEERLGMRLINRTTRRQSLTDFGRAYYERCRIVLAEAQAADALAADQLSEPRGKLRVTMPAHFGRHCVTPILIELARRYPTLELDLSLSDRFVDLVEDGFDLAIRTGTLDDRAGIIARRVARQRMIVCASPSYIESFGRPLQPEDIASHQAIVYRRLGHVLQPWLFTRDDDSVTQIAPAGRLRLDDLDAIADAATDGMGLAWLPYWLVRQRIEGGTLVRLLPEQRDYLYDCHALRLQAPHLPLKVRLAVDALAVGLPKMMS
ncbi:LysR family transcriptional regulator [Mesorhizobium sp. CA5]|uniref:LysR family transcriptional regulator n=1 Tax=Mesorhizobium sp. CA5 TaxID=2876638 RepID=UPI001CD15858|nr:LysR family transcriptional regulator [Mesorhizobium sp. CA5]MBZ9842771.1 LysR family transcriptional regulator [Mesorhizobium sp. CA5]